MDVRDIQGTVLAPEQQLITKPVAAELTTQRAESVATNTAGDVVSVTTNTPERTYTTLQKSINETITTINVAADATAEIARFARSISGITEQALDPELSAQRRTLLEKEANELVTAIKNQVEGISNRAPKPLSGDSIRLEIEETLGKTLEVLLPHDARDNFGIGTIAFSPREAIIQTRTTLAEAEARIQKLQQAIADTKARLKQSLDEVDVARQNHEASLASIRDVDEALSVAGLTRGNILEDPRGALKSFDKLSATSLELLK